MPRPTRTARSCIAPRPVTLRPSRSGFLLLVFSAATTTAPGLCWSSRRWWGGSLMSRGGTVSWRGCCLPWSNSGVLSRRLPLPPRPWRRASRTPLTAGGVCSTVRWWGTSPDGSTPGRSRISPSSPNSPPPGPSPPPATPSRTPICVPTTCCSRTTAGSSSSTGRTPSLPPPGSTCWSCCRVCGPKAARIPRSCSAGIPLRRVPIRPVSPPPWRGSPRSLSSTRSCPPPPGLPTLRAFQRAQGDAALAWLRTRWETAPSQ